MSNKNEWWSGNKSILYGILGCFFVFALLIHWNQNYRKYDTSTKVEVITNAEIRSLLKIVKEYKDLHSGLADPQTYKVMPNVVAEVDPPTPYEQWAQDQIPVSIEASIVRISKARLYLKEAKESAKEQIKLSKENQPIGEELKDKMRIALGNAAKEAIDAESIINEYLEKNP